MTTDMKKFRVLLFTVLVLLVVMLYIAVYQKHVNQVPIAVPVETPSRVGVYQPVLPKLEPTVKADMEPQRGRVHVCIFTGRWRYLRILLPYLYRELRQNGGVVDKVIFAMIGFDVETQTKLKNLSTTANSVLKDEAFQFVYFKDDPLTKRMNLQPFYAKFHYYVFQRLVENPSDVYFKLDDDIVYISPNVFSTMLKNKNPSDCFIHFANIVSNWRCNWLHQQIGVFDTEVNPKGLKIDYHPNGECGWKRADCAEMVLRAFLYHYHNNQTRKYIFHGRNHTTDRLRFSINFFLFDVTLIDVRRIIETGLIGDDEDWWTVKYSKNAPHPNCIVGEAFVVHFSYFTTEKQMLDLGLLKEFENIVRMELGDKLPQPLWKATEFL